MITPLDLQATLALHPDLTYGGFYRQIYSKPTTWWTGLSHITEMEFKRARADLLSPRAMEAAATAHAYLQNIKPIQTCTAGSYGAKHCAERWGREHGMSGYVSNGVLIMVALTMGFPMKSEGENSPNCRFGMSKKDVKRIDPQEIRHRENKHQWRKAHRLYG